MATSAGMPPALDDLLAHFRRLVEENSDDAQESAPEDTGNFRCEDCVRCTHCRFCKSCEGCEDCTYCESSVDCRGCTQGRELLACVGCTQCQFAAYCEQSSYLSLCYACSECVHCFACVGIEGAEFCILNEPYSRREYFKAVAEYRQALESRFLQGWVPPWLGDEVESQGREAPIPSESTGSWPPADPESARLLDRGEGDDDLWAELDDLTLAPAESPQAAQAPPPLRFEPPAEALGATIPDPGPPVRSRTFRFGEQTGQGADRWSSPADKSSRWQGDSKSPLPRSEVSEGRPPSTSRWQGDAESPLPPGPRFRGRTKPS